MTWNNTTLRELERQSIRDFLESCVDHFRGRVLDIGSGQQPYRDIVERVGGDYVPYDGPQFPASVADKDTTGGAWGRRDFDTLLSTQVLQYIEDPVEWLGDHRMDHLRVGGTLVVTTGLTWPEVEPQDLHRLTRAGLLHLLVDAGFTVDRIESRAALKFDGFELSLGYGLVATA